jgi:hypothetical protein
VRVPAGIQLPPPGPVRRGRPGRRRVGAGGDRLDHQGREGHLADAGVALGAWLETAAEPAGLVVHVDHLEHRQWALQVDPPPTEPGELAEP